MQEVSSNLDNGKVLKKQGEWFWGKFGGWGQISKKKKC